MSTLRNLDLLPLIWCDTVMTPLEQLCTFLRFPSISADPAYAGDVRDCAAWLADKLNGMGLTTKVYPTAGHPIVVARNESQAGRPTVMIYGHYDVQPVDPIELWDSDPFDPVVHDGRIWGRGTADDKGQLFTHVLGVEALLKSDGQLPVNLIFVFEGEEEVGSGNLINFLKEYKEELACDIVIVSDTGMVAEGMPSLSYGLRGVAACEVIVRGPRLDLHSGEFGGVVANPITALCELVASFHDKEGRVAIDGFYADVRPLEDWERRMWSTIPNVTDDDYKAITGSPSVYGEAGFTSQERIWARPTAELNGIYGGYQGPGSKTVIPTHAVAKFSFRLVPDQDPSDILKKVCEHCKRNAPKGISVEFIEEHVGSSYIMDPHSHFGMAAQESIEEVFGCKPVLTRVGGSIGVVNEFKATLGVDTLLIGLSLPDCKIHSPNENFPISHFEAGIQLNQALLRRLGEIRL